jgi:cupin 2 domain-containing protein
MQPPTDPAPGRYQHYKGQPYTVLGTARHSETLEELVVYRQAYGDHGLWVRPRAMFQELVTTADGQSVPRFAAANPPEQHSAGSGSEAINRGNLLGKIPQTLPEELMQTLLEADGVRLERIVSHGHASPEGFWYDQPDDEWILILHGAARLQLEDGDITLRPGDYLNIPAHRKHRVAWTSPDEPTVWLAVWYTAHQASRD